MPNRIAITDSEKGYLKMDVSDLIQRFQTILLYRKDIDRRKVYDILKVLDHISQMDLSMRYKRSVSSSLLVDLNPPLDVVELDDLSVDLEFLMKDFTEILKRKTHISRSCLVTIMDGLSWIQTTVERGISLR